MNELPTHLDLFSGIGGFALAALRAGFRTIGFCEIDKYCQKVLAKNFGAIPCRDNAELLPIGAGTSQRPSEGYEGRDFPSLSSNIFDFDGVKFRGVSLITGGFPCQPFSVAGKRGGAGDDRAIWPEMFRVISEARPAFVLGENVPGIIPMELDNVLSDLEGIGYATRSFVIPACAVDARHRRDRVWIVGRNVSDPPGDGCELSVPDGGAVKSSQRHAVAGTGDVSQPTTERLQEQWPSGEQESRTYVEQGLPVRCGEGGRYATWPLEPGICRVVNGLRGRVDRLKGLGNAIVPQVAYEILREIRQLL